MQASGQIVTSTSAPARQGVLFGEPLTVEERRAVRAGGAAENRRGRQATV